MRQTSKALLCAGLLPAQERRIVFFWQGYARPSETVQSFRRPNLEKSLVAPAQAGAQSEALLQLYIRQRQSNEKKT